MDILGYLSSWLVIIKIIQIGTETNTFSIAKAQTIEPKYKSIWPGKKTNDTTTAGEWPNTLIREKEKTICWLKIKETDEEEEVENNNFGQSFHFGQK